MAEKPKLQSDVIVSTETCHEDDLDFFEQPTKEFELCKLENKVAEFQDFIKENPKTSIIDLLKKSPIIDSKDLIGTKYDPLEYFENPPVIGMIGRKANKERTAYVTFKEHYGERYTDILFTTDSRESSANGLFVNYNGVKGILTTSHSGIGFIKSLEGENYPNNHVNTKLDILFIELDDILFSNISKDLRKRLFKITSPVDISQERRDIDIDISSAVGYDDGGNSYLEHKDLKLISGIPFKVTENMETEILDTWIKHENRQKDEIKQKYTGKELEEELAARERNISYFNYLRGRFVGKYIYRISSKDHATLPGISGSPVFQKGLYVGNIYFRGDIGGMNFTLFTPVDDIEKEVLSKIQ